MSECNNSIKQLTIELIRSCPNRCLHCSSNSSPEVKEFLDVDKVKYIIDQAFTLGLREVILSGGEPLCYPEIHYVIEYLRSLGIEIVIYTSGSIFDDNHTPKSVPNDFVRSLIMGVDRFNLSFHSVSPEVHDYFMATPGSWSRALEFLREVVKQGGKIHTHTVVTKLNYAEILELAHFLDEIGVSTLRLMRLVPQGRALLFNKELELTETDWLKVRSQLEGIYSNKALSIKIQLGAHLPSTLGQDTYQCSLDKGKLLIDPHGTVAVCPALKGMSAVTGAPNALQATLMSIISSDWRTSMANLKRIKIESKCSAEQVYKEKLVVR